MYHDFNYETALASSLRAQWQLDDVLRTDQELDFSRNMMPESLARTGAAAGLNPFEQRILNQISAHQYLSIFGVVEEFILPFLLDHARLALRDDDYRVRALLNFAGEEAKHIHLFKRFHDAFRRGFPVECQVIGPSEAIGAKILSHDPLAVGLVILMIEWMTQSHYIDSIKDDNDIDPLFKSLLKNHWLEEAQHAKLDSRMVESLGEGLSEEQVEQAIDGFLKIGAFLDTGLRQQTLFELEAFELATGRVLRDDEREIFISTQHQTNRWTYIGSGMVHPKFLMSLERLSPAQKARIEAVAPTFG